VQSKIDLGIIFDNVLSHDFSDSDLNGMIKINLNLECLPRWAKLICVCLLISATPATAAVDLNGDGASEIWNLLYPEVLPDDGDFDGDGQSNISEMIAGTSPTDSSDWFHIGMIQVADDEVVLGWEGVPGKVYEIEARDRDSGAWETKVTISPVIFPQAMTVTMPSTDSAGVYRLVANDFDSDGDGVEAWEEFLMGWSDQSTHSSGQVGIPDYEQAIRQLESAGGTTLVNGESLERRLPTDEEAARFLIQSSFGPTMDSIRAVTENGITGYLDEQLSATPSLTRSEMWETGMTFSSALWRHGWWRAALIAPDQLNQRMAYALSQIFVVNNESGSVIGDNINTQAAYYDIFVKNGFGAFRKILNDVTYSSSMGFYLSHLNNRKGDLSINRFPDENFAREIMQLFTIGLWKLNPDGTHQLDDGGKSIPTYDNEVIKEMAKVFTGMSHSTTKRGQPATSFYDFGAGSDYVNPMKVWDEEHELGTKVLFDGVVIPAGQTGEDDVQQTLDALCAHQNVAPFICFRLIQRFTTSNPSPAYLRRVTSSWDASDGDLGEVLKAILLDPEVRAGGGDSSQSGKIREPLIRLTHILRAFADPDTSGKYGAFHTTLKAELGQYAMSSPSVFNFYLPDYTPRGEPYELGLKAPELQIATTSSLLATHDRLKKTATIGHFVRGIDYSEELDLTDDPDQLADRLDLLLTWGEMSPNTKSVIMERINNEFFQLEKVRAAVQIIVTSPEFSVLR
jgi:uncharacterized protein (DUF1800 family)